MTQKALIWDLDGTLFDSYKVIIPNALQTFLEFGVDYDPDYIRRYTLGISLGDLFIKTGKEYGCSSDALHKRYLELQAMRDGEIPPMPHSMEILAAMAQRGIYNLVYTHKGDAAFDVLDRLGFTQYFTEIITGDSGFARKPDPEAIFYLMEKYGLEKEDTFYVGDRPMDIQCAVNAGIRSILLQPEDNGGSRTGKEDFVVKDLLEILDIV